MHCALESDLPKNIFGDFSSIAAELALLDFFNEMWIHNIALTDNKIYSHSFLAANYSTIYILKFFIMLTAKNSTPRTTEIVGQDRKPEQLLSRLSRVRHFLGHQSSWVETLAFYDGRMLLNNSSETFFQPLSSSDTWYSPAPIVVSLSTRQFFTDSFPLQTQVLCSEAVIFEKRKISFAGSFVAAAMAGTTSKVGRVKRPTYSSQSSY